MIFRVLNNKSLNWSKWKACFYLGSSFLVQLRREGGDVGTMGDCSGAQWDSQVILLCWLVFWGHYPLGCSQLQSFSVAKDFFLSLLEPSWPSHGRSKPASRERKECFLPLNQKSHTLHQKTPVGVRQEKKKSGSLAAYGAAREAGRALYLTAPLSEPSQQPRTTPRCHLQL